MFKDYFNEQVIFVADDAGILTGFVVGYKYPWGNGWRLWVSEIGVSSDQQGKGAGTLLFDRLVNHFKGKTDIVERLVHKDFPAVKFYKKHGFKLSDYIKFEKNI